MKNLTAAILCSAALLATPATSGSLADPVVAPEVVVADATQSSDDIDALMLAIWTMLFITAVAGAF